MTSLRSSLHGVSQNTRGASKGRWFLLGHAPRTNQPITLYALDRIRHLAPASDISYLPSALRPETYFANLIGVSVPATTVVFGADVEVLALPTLRTEMAAALQVAAGVYDKE